VKGIWKDIRYGWRRILRRPLPNLVVLVSLALGIGVNAAVFSLVYGILMRPLPFAHPERLLRVIESYPQSGDSATSPPNFLDLRRSLRPSVQLAAFADADSVLTLPQGRPERLAGAAVSADFFSALGSRFVAGRNFLADEDRAGAPAAVVLSSALWQRRFAASPRLIGGTIRLDDQPYTVVGVVDSRLTYPKKAEYWIPLALENNEKQRGARWLGLLGRLRPGVSLAQAQALADTTAGGLAGRYPQTDSGIRLKLQPLRDYLVRNLRPSLLILAAIAGAVLLITLANVASILLARFVERAPELAIRSAVGSPRVLLLRPFLAETLTLSLGGGLLGLLLAFWLVALVGATSPELAARQDDVRLGLPVVIFSLAVAALVGLLLGSLPLLRRSLLRPAGLLHSAGRSPGGRDLSILRLNRFIAGFEVTLAVALAISSGLLIRSLANLTAVSTGFRADATLAVDVSLPQGRYPDAERRADFYTRLLGEVDGLPGVQHAGLVFPVPLSDIAYSLSFEVEGRPQPDPAKAPTASVRFISPHLPEALGLPVNRGRGFTAADGASSPPVVLINRKLARRFWPTGEPLGQRLAIGAHKEWATIVGVVGDLRGSSLRGDADSEIYRPLAQAPQSQATLVVRARDGSSVRPAAVSQRVEGLDRSLLLEDFRTLRQSVLRTTARERFQTLLVGIFAVLALGLAASGVYGILSHSVAQRTHEIGLRMALGASRSGIQRLILGQGARVILWGLGAGSLLSVIFSRALAGSLYGVGTIDLPTLGAVAALIALIGLLAITLPVHRASAVEPIVALRYD
jgi:predicted permease